MDESIEIQILKRIKKAGRGVLFFTESFVSYGSAEAVKKALLQGVAECPVRDKMLVEDECYRATGLAVRYAIRNIFPYILPRTSCKAQVSRDIPCAWECFILPTFCP